LKNIKSFLEKKKSFKKLLTNYLVFAILYYIKGCDEEVRLSFFSESNRLV